MYSLNQDPHRGSYYIEDTRNIFRNPADINLFKDYATFELEFIPKDSQLSLVPQGGYFTHLGKFPVGIFLGQGMVEGFLLTDEFFNATPTDLFLSTGESNPVSFFFGGGDKDFQWGVDIRIVNSHITVGGNQSSEEALSCGLGFNIGSLNIYGKYDIKEKTQVTGSDLSQDGTFETFGFIAGAIYRFERISLLIDYIKGKTELTGRTDTSQNGIAQSSTLSLGIGHINELNDFAKLFFNLNLENEKEEISAHHTDTTNNRLPLVLGFEVDATSWLILRGSVVQNIFLSTYSFQTRVNLGGTLSFGKLKVDGNLGMNEISLLNASAFFANAAFTYWF